MSKLFSRISSVWVLCWLPASIATDFFSATEISSLPQNAIYQQGGLSLFLQLEEVNGKDHFPVIYVINDSDKDILLPAQDGDLYLKQEAQIDGEWIRVQPHRYSWCGNSYVSQPIAAKRFMRYPGVFHGWAPPVEAEKKDTFKKYPVRYRFYNEATEDLFSNGVEMAVSMELAEIAKYDYLAIKNAPIDLLLEVASGAVSVASVDHISVRTESIRRLPEFKDDRRVKSVITKLVNEGVPVKEGSDDGLWQASGFRYEDVIDSAVDILSPEKVFPLLKQKIGEFEDMDQAILRKIEDIKGLSERKIQLYDEYLHSPDDPLYSTALKLRCNYWAEAEMIKKLKKVFNDSSFPGNVRSEALSEYYRRFRNEFIQVWTKYSFETSLKSVKIENTSAEPITLTYTHPYDIIDSEVEIEWGTFNFVPYRADIAAIIDRERHDEVKEQLMPGEKLDLGEINIWRYHRLPNPLPEKFAYRIVSKLPQFGDVPAGVGTTGFFEVEGQKKEILESALADQEVALE